MVKEMAILKGLIDNTGALILLRRKHNDLRILISIMTYINIFSEIISNFAMDSKAVDHFIVSD